MGWPYQRTNCSHFGEDSLSRIDKLELYFHTLRYLKPIQVWGRVVVRLKRSKPDLRPAPARRPFVASWQKPVMRRLSMVEAARFLFLNEGHEVSAFKDWNSPAVAKLWLYNLHYFDDLNACAAEERSQWHRDLIQRWTFENPPGKGLGWETYPLSLRMVNWIKWALAGNTLSDVALHSLAIQTRFLTKHLEMHLLGNHLFANAKALVFAGCFFDGEEALQWLRLGMGILKHELAEQILADGGHFERSTMYHALVLEDLLDLVNLVRAFPAVFLPWQKFVADWPKLARGMGHWLAAMCHPDGEISFFNDAAMGIAPSLEELVYYAQRLDIAVDPPIPDGVIWLGDSGYARIQKKDAVCIVDMAAVGPDYLPGHAHADTLSFELSLFNRRVLVNSGTSQYGDDAHRQKQRGSAAHNTVRIDGQNSSEVWAGFRVARRAHVVVEVVPADGNEVLAIARHDGYCRLPGQPIHRRNWRFSECQLEVVDEITGRGLHTIESFLHFHPDILPQRIRADRVELVDRQSKAVLAALTCLSGLEIELGYSLWYPEFGKEVRNQYCLLRQAAVILPVTSGFTIEWVNHHSQNAKSEILH